MSRPGRWRAVRPRRDRARCRCRCPAPRRPAAAIRPGAACWAPARPAIPGSSRCPSAESGSGVRPGSAACPRGGGTAPGVTGVTVAEVRHPVHPPSGPGHLRRARDRRHPRRRPPSRARCRARGNSRGRNGRRGRPGRAPRQRATASVPAVGEPAAAQSASMSRIEAGESGGSPYCRANTCRRAPGSSAVRIAGCRAARSARSGSVATPSPAAHQRLHGHVVVRGEGDLRAEPGQRALRHQVARGTGRSRRSTGVPRTGPGQRTPAPRAVHRWQPPASDLSRCPSPGPSAGPRWWRAARVTR